MTISDASHFDAVRTGLETIAAIRSLHPERFAWVNNEDGYWIDSLLGTDRIRLAMNAGESIENIIEREQSSLDDFLRLRGEHLLYEAH